MSVTLTLFSKRRWFQLGIIFTLFGASAYVATEILNLASWWAHGLWCATGILLILPVVVKVMRADFRVALSDHRIMFTFAFALYFLFGASLLSFGPERDIANVLNYYPVSPADAMRVDAINAMGFGLALLVSALIKGRWIGELAILASAAASKISAMSVLLTLTVIGVLATYKVVMVDFGFTDGTAASIWRTTSQFTFVSILLGSAYRGQHELIFRLVAILMAVGATFIGILSFSKTGMLLPIGSLIAGLAMRFSVSKVLPLGIVILVVLFISTGGAMSSARNNLEIGTPHSLDTRWQVVKFGLLASRAGDERSRQYNTWGRFCYVPPQVAAYDFYNDGRGGDDLRLIPWLFIPRGLVPEKPIITQTSRDFHYKISGNRGSSTGMGIFLSGYYNAGWLGVLLVAGTCGWILAQTSAIASVVLERKARMYKTNRA